ncbi:regulatory protein RecX [Velocimicrobium porci]|uniref:Regulatory protein RecX n=1 Tax=Velocimicrobium porci TaxID=2606634 RepID=A0A6L5XYT6_9FIRM|nr:regulatory protein RecX [Velocimicrobium porci]MSS63368.1 regulatory protein RecX [Velocimicrobium porci]
MEQVITSLEYVEKKKVRVYINDEFAFPLYQSEIKKYSIEEGQFIEQERYNKIMEEIIFRRAKQKAMNLLKRMDRTEQELRTKLRQAEYPSAAVETAIEYVKSYHYIDDLRYAENYIRYKKGTKSIRMIEMELRQKGIDKESIRSALEEETISDDEALKKAIRKKAKNWDTMSYLEKRKVFAYLYRKGFKEEDIRKYLEF